MEMWEGDYARGELAQSVKINILKEDLHCHIILQDQETKLIKQHYYLKYSQLEHWFEFTSEEFNLITGSSKQVIKDGLVYSLAILPDIYRDRSGE